MSVFVCVWGVLSVSQQGAKQLTLKINNWTTAATCGPKVSFVVVVVAMLSFLVATC